MSSLARSTHMSIDPPVTPASVRAAIDAALHELRDAAGTLAAKYGHQLGGWHASGGANDEVAYCRHCRRAVVIDVVRDPHLAGQAITQRCPNRPDAFLANQHESDVIGGGR